MMLPPLYKYRPVNDYTLNSLREGYLYFSNPTTFNDPFEFRAFTDCSLNPEARKKDIMKMLEVSNPLLTFEARKRKAAKLMVDKDFISGMNNESYFDEESLQSTCLFCMSGNRGNLLQWAHYADDHRGVCIEIDPNSDPLLSESEPVIYTDEYPIIDAYAEYERSHFEKIALTKSRDWEYENEFRTFLKKERESFNHLVKSETLVSVTFGARAESEQRKLIIEACQEKFSHVDFFEARLADRKYALDFFPFDG